MVERTYSMLNMSSVSDLTARARVRDAAIDLFGRVGFERATVRDVAAAAEVSPALVIHHFSSKDGLREACDAHVTSLLFDKKHDLLAPGAAAAIRAWLADFDQFRPLLRYIGRMLIDGSEVGRDLFAAFHEGTRLMLDEQAEAGILRDLPDRGAVAAYLTVFGLAPIILQEHLASAFGVAEMTGEVYRRSTLPLLDLYTNGLYADDRFLRLAAEAIGETPPGTADTGKDS